MHRVLVVLALMALATPALAQPAPPVPEPGALALMVLAAGGILLARRRR